MTSIQELFARIQASKQKYLIAKQRCGRLASALVCTAIASVFLLQVETKHNTEFYIPELFKIEADIFSIDDFAQLKKQEDEHIKH